MRIRLTKWRCRTKPERREKGQSVTLAEENESNSTPVWELGRGLAQPNRVQPAKVNTVPACERVHSLWFSSVALLCRRGPDQDPLLCWNSSTAAANLRGGNKPGKLKFREQQSQLQHWRRSCNNAVHGCRRIERANFSV